MKIKDILGISKAKLIKGNINDGIDNFSKDTRTIKEGDTYIGIAGEVYDGSKFYKEALEKGAKTCILKGSEEDFKEIDNYDGNIILVEDTLEFLMEIAKRKRDSLKIPIVAVTGSVGKTSTKNIIADVLGTKYKVKKTGGNLNTNIGIALTILEIKDEEVLVLEMGMSKFGEIRELSNIAKPDIAVITNIGTAHIGYLGSRENILKAKLEILEGLKGPIIINNDNDLLNAWHKNNTIANKVITYGINTESDYQARDLEYDNLGSHFKLNNEEVLVNVLGEHFIYNAMAAYAVADLFKISHDLVREKLQNLVVEPGRMEIIKRRDYTIINDAYNASFDSVYYALQVLSSFPGRKIAVLGDILELGDWGEKIHRDIGGLVQDNKIDILITIGSLAEYISDEAIKRGMTKDKVRHYLKRDEAINYINEIKRANDIILVKASHGMELIKVVENI